MKITQVREEQRIETLKWAVYAKAPETPDVICVLVPDGDGIKAVEYVRVDSLPVSARKHAKAHGGLK